MLGRLASLASFGDNNMSIYHQILGVNEDAKIEEIKSKYRELCKVYHPDISNSEEINKMAIINEAYNVLTKSSQRTIASSSRDITNTNSIILYNDQAFAFYRQASKQIQNIRSFREKITMFHNEEAVREYQSMVLKSLYYYNIVCMQYGESEYYEDSIERIKELNRDRIISKNVGEYEKLLTDEDNLHSGPKKFNMHSGFPCVNPSSDQLNKAVMNSYNRKPK